MEVGDPAIEVSQAILGVQPDGLAVIIDRFLVLLIIIIGESAVVAVSSVIGVEPDRFGVVFDRSSVFVSLIVN
jgi:hypothetical protein